MFNALVQSKQKNFFNVGIGASLVISYPDANEKLIYLPFASITARYLDIQETVDSRQAVDIMTITLWLEQAQIDDHNVMVAKKEEIAWRKQQKKRD